MPTPTDPQSHRKRHCPATLDPGRDLSSGPKRAGAYLGGARRLEGQLRVTPDIPRSGQQ
jgi:hypothetical protein